MHPSAAGAPQPCLSYDFVADRAHDGKAFRMLCIIDEFARERLAIRVTRRRDEARV
jgi:putative transposase